MATLLFLAASITQVPAIRHARTAGHRVVAVDGDPEAAGFAFANEAVAVDFTDVDAVSAAGRAHSVDGVLAISSDRAVAPAASVAEALGLPGIGVAVAHGMTDKPTMRSTLGRARVPQPRHAILTASSDPEAAGSLVGYPAVLKPADSGGQRGVFMVRKLDDVRAHLDEALAFSATGRAILEQYVDGTELNGILVVRDGEPTLITLSDRLRPRGRAFGVGWIHSYPSSLAPDLLERARDVAFAAVRALGLRDGIAFPQLIASGEDVQLIEIAARIAAGQMADLVRFATGIELFDVAIAQALGRPVETELIEPRATRPIAIRFLTAQPGVLPLGTVTFVGGLDDVQSSPGVLAAGTYFEPGAVITPLQVDADRRGYVVATGDTPEVALALAEAAARKLVVHTVQPVTSARARVVVAPVVAAVAAVVALVAFLPHATFVPRLMTSTIGLRAGKLHVRYAFNEPVRAELLVNGTPATAFSRFRRAGELSVNRSRRAHVAIEAVDKAGHRSIVPLSS